MLKKANRLSKDRDIKQVFARGRGFFNPFLQLRYSKTQGAPKWAYVISTKVSKSAVKRNRLKRILREWTQKKLGACAGGDYVLVVKPAAAAVEEKNLLASLGQLLSNARLLQ